MKTNGIKKAVFIDRDGVLNEMVFDKTHGLLDSPRRPEQVALMPGAVKFLKALHDMGYLRVIVTNQPGLAKGTLTREELEAVNARLAELLAAQSVAWDDLRFCPHHPTGDATPVAEYVQECECRKPKPGMLCEAAHDLGIDLEASWMIGDGLTDVQAGHAAGCRTVLLGKIKIMHIERFFDIKGSEPDVIVPDLGKALEVIKAG